MPTRRNQILKEFDDAVAGLRSLLRSRQLLTDSEQLFIENRLMILQIEYRLWANDVGTQPRYPSHPHTDTGQTYATHTPKRSASLD